MKEQTLKKCTMKFDIQLQAAQSHFSNNTLEMEDSVLDAKCTVLWHLFD